MVGKQLKLMYITNNIQVAEIALDAGADIIFIDMEYMGKDARQNGMDTVKNHHTIDDIKSMRTVFNNYDKDKMLLARVNPIHSGSEEEIRLAIKNGADIVMLPMWRTAEEVRSFVKYVDKKAKVFLLLETKEAVEIIDEVLNIDGIDCIYIGLNDLHLSYGMKFMFQPLTEGIVDYLTEKIKRKNIQFGFGGIAKLHEGAVPAEKILGEHIRLGSDMVILSRSFCNSSAGVAPGVLRKSFTQGVADLRAEEEKLKSESFKYLENNHTEIKKAVDKIVKGE